MDNNVRALDEKDRTVVAEILRRYTQLPSLFYYTATAESVFW
jgi:hypothetical protein